MPTEAYRFDARKEDKTRRSAKQGMEFCKVFIKEKLPFGIFRMTINDKIFPNIKAANAGVMKFDTKDQNIIHKIDILLEKIIVLDKKIFNNCYYVVVDCNSFSPQ